MKGECGEMSKITFSEKIIKKIKVPGRISIGDRIGVGKTLKENDLFLRNFRNREEWIGEAILKNAKITTSDGVQNAYYLVLMYAPDKKLLDLYKDNSVYAHHNVEESEVVTNTKNPILCINGKSIAFEMQNSGLFADILEIYSMSNSLNGFIVTIYVGNDINEKKFINNILDIV